LNQQYSVAGLSDVGRGDKVDVINSWDSGAADTEVYVHSADLNWIHVQDEHTGLLPARDVPCAMDSDKRKFLILAAHLRDRAPKYEHQAQAKKNVADDSFHVNWLFHFVFPFLFLDFAHWGSLLRYCKKSGAI
jgi:hypothetical protein